MSTSTLPAPVVQGEVVEPSATAGPVAAAAFKLGNVLKELIHAVPQAFHGENDILAAVGDVDTFIKAFVKRSEMPALADGNQRAPMEDVSQRQATVTTYGIPVASPSINYDLLAAAIVRQQAIAQAQAAADAEAAKPAPAPPPPAEEQGWAQS